MVRDAVVADPSAIGGTIVLDVPASDPYDQLSKGLVDRGAPEDRRRLNDAQIGWFDALKAEGLVTRPFNTALFLNPDSRFPEVAGLKGAIVGTFYAILVCFLISFPLGIAAAIYLEEFAPKNRATDVIEVNINNLAAVPSIVFGLLGLALFIQTFGLPRSSPLVGGMVLGADHAADDHHRHPQRAEGGAALDPRGGLRHRRLAAPGGDAPRPAAGDARHHDRHDHRPRPRARRDRAAAPRRHERLHHQPARAACSTPRPRCRPRSIIWADSPERGFVARTSAAILVLLGFLLVMNAIAIFVRQRLERSW